ncbi:hypothetical protein E4U61_000351 [Claviceps capensis]|nr:hypothetical protein E4U61_000351 [Claviceps capensis]
MANFPEDVRYFEQYKLNRFVAQIQTRQNHAWWPEESDHGGANAGDPANNIESAGDSERLSHKRKRSSSTSSAELRADTSPEQCDIEELGKHIIIDRETASHDAQLKRQRNAESSKRSRTGLKTMREELDESQKARRLAEEQRLQERQQRLQAEGRARQEREQRLQTEERARQTEAELRQIRQQLANKR